MKKKVLKNNVKEWRMYYGITQKQLADLIGVRRETIAYIEKGDFHLTSVKIAFDIANVFNRLITEVFYLEEVEDEKS